MKKCHKCGSELADDARFCLECGTECRTMEGERKPKSDPKPERPDRWSATRT